MAIADYQGLIGDSGTGALSARYLLGSPAAGGHTTYGGTETLEQSAAALSRLRMVSADISTHYQDQARADLDRADQRAVRRSTGVRMTAAERRAYLRRTGIIR